MSTIDFKEHEDAIKHAVLEKLQGKNSSCKAEDIIIVGGFFNQPIQNQLTGAIYVGGPSVPMVAAAEKSGEMHFFALKLLLPDIKF